MREIKLAEIQVGEKVKAVSTYWRSGSDSQEDTEIVEMRIGQKGRQLFKENGEPYYVGVNSAVQFFPLTTEKNGI